MHASGLEKIERHQLGDVEILCRVFLETCRLSLANHREERGWTLKT
jgi:hypothetical protein